jgi:hypothetical protein
MENCFVCIENFNKSVHSPIECPHCQFKSCLKCNKQFLIESINDAHCMNCKKPWTHDFLHLYFPKSFLNKEYASKKKDLIYERELVYLKDSQDAFIASKKKKEMAQQIQVIEENIKKLRLQIYNYQTEQNTLYNKIHKMKVEKSVSDNIKCIKEDCLGYLVQYKCPVCEIKVCSKCLIEKTNENHECDPALVETINLIKKECKPCPKCHISIYKVKGCDQMWCTQCQVIFSWKTGEQVKNTTWIHNPHYLEYIANNDSVQNECNREQRLPSYKLISNFIKTYPYRDMIYYVYQQSGHIFDIELGRYDRYTFNHTFNTFLNERLLYMENKLDKDQFQQILIKKYRANDKFSEFSQLIRSFVQIIQGIFYKLVADKKIIEDNTYLILFKQVICEYWNLFENALKKHNSSWSNPFDMLYKEYNKLTLE